MSHERRLFALCAIAGCLTVSACATSSSSKPPPPSLSKRVVQAGDLTGFSPGKAREISLASKWAEGNPSLSTARRTAETTRLEREGYRRVHALPDTQTS